MDLETACSAVRECLDAMESLYVRPVFDEWAIVTLSEGRARILHYDGARPDAFAQSLADDLRYLRQHLQSDALEAGDFEFARDAHGTGFDALIALGGKSFLLCNNTLLPFSALAVDPLWRKAQVPFVDLTETFRLHSFIPPVASAA